jgi:hypothetical protein
MILFAGIGLIVVGAILLGYAVAVTTWLVQELRQPSSPLDHGLNMIATVLLLWGGGGLYVTGIQVAWMGVTG